MKKIINERGSALAISFIVVLAVVATAGLIAWSAGNRDNISVSKNDSMMEKDLSEAEVSDAMMEDDKMMKENSSEDEISESMMREGVIIDDNMIMEDGSSEAGTIDKMAEEGASMPKKGEYRTYSLASYNAAQEKTRVLFFHAEWCPTCKAANSDISANLDKFPENIVILKTDYDTETELKKKYGITYQHTFVQVDAEGNAVKKWNGGGVDEIISNVELGS